MKLFYVFIISLFIFFNAQAQDDELSKGLEDCYAKRKILIDSVTKLKINVTDLVRENAELKIKNGNYKTIITENKIKMKELAARGDSTRELRLIVDNNLKLIDSLKKENVDISTLNDKYAETISVLRQLQKKYEQDLGTDSLLIVALNTEIYIKSLRAEEFTVQKDRKNGFIDIAFYIKDSEGNFPFSNDTTNKGNVNLSLEIFQSPEKVKLAAKTNQSTGALTLGASDNTNALYNRGEKTNVLKRSQPLKVLFTQNDAFTNKKIESNHYEIRIFYKDSNNFKTLIGTYVISLRTIEQYKQ